MNHLLDWARQRLRAQDRIGVAVFAKDARMILPLTPSRELPSTLDQRTDVGSETRFQSVADLVKTFPDRGAHTSLLLLSDGAFNDMPADATSAGRQLNDAGIDSLQLLVPSRFINPPDNFSEIYPTQPRIFDGLNSDDTTWVIAEVLAAETRQSLARTTP